MRVLLKNPESTTSRPRLGLATRVQAFPDQRTIKVSTGLKPVVPAAHARGEAPPRILHVKPALEWKAKILVVKDVPEGALVGYGGSFRAPRPMRIGVLAVGYADGLPHRLSNKGRILAGGKPTHILGTVSMDLTTIDITHCSPIAVGDAVTLLGSEGGVSIDAQQIARVAGTISYSVLCGIHARVKRIYVDQLQ